MNLLETYNFHDTIMNSIDLECRTIKMHYREGIYLLNNDQCRETRIPCDLILELDVRNHTELINCVQIRVEKKRKVFEISVEKLRKMLQAAPFDIILYYSSPFNRSYLFCGYVGKARVELSISNVFKTQVVFHQ